MSRALRVGLFTLVAALVTPQAYASLIIKNVWGGATPAGYTQITPDENTDLRDYALGGGTIHFEDKHGNSLKPRSGNGWWKYSASMPIFTTHTSTIEITFSNLDVYGFAFNLGANRRSRAWFTVDYETPTGMEQISRYGIKMKPGKSPGFDISNSGTRYAQGGCHKISKIVIDPRFTWGIGNMSIDTGGASGCAVDVPEPGTLPLLLLGALGLVAVRKLQVTQAS